MASFKVHSIMFLVAMHMVTSSDVVNTCSDIGQCQSNLELEAVESSASLLQVSQRTQKSLATINDLDIEASTGSFISNNALLCVEGLARAAVGALGLKQAGVVGALYNETSVRTNTTCSSRGYSLDAGEDPTYVGVRMFFRTEAEQIEFKVAKDQALEEFGTLWGLSLAMASLMSSCTAHLESDVGKSVQGQCDTVNSVTASWMHHDLVDRSAEHCCDDGPFQQTVFALAVLKTTKQFPQHPYDQVKVGSCSDFGYETPLELVAPPDHCFSAEPTWRMHFHYNEERGYQGSVDTEAILFGTENGFIEEGLALGLDSGVMQIMDSMPGCHCLPGTEVSIPLEAAGACAQQSPIREWWQGQ